MYTLTELAIALSLIITYTCNLNNKLRQILKGFLNMSLNTGDKLTKKAIVTEKMLACNVGSGSLRVLATPIVAAFMENTACELAQKELEDIYTTVGTQISIEHTSPTPIGAEISVTAELEKTDGRIFYFKVYAEDKKGEIAKGNHTRVSVKSEGFQKKADGKFNG